MSDIKYWLAFSRIPNLGTVKFRLLEGYFGSLEQAWTSDLRELRAAGIDNKRPRLL
jgi:predicted Rossmann fold nucleotide-binding protein DprA/Smf involved in DNA uptake